MSMFIGLLLVLMLINPAVASDFENSVKYLKVQSLHEFSNWSMFKKDLSHSGFTSDTVNPPLVLKWKYYIGYDTDSSPVIVNDVLYTGSDYGIHAIDARSGIKLWETHTNSFVKSVPTVVDGVIYAGAEDKRFYAIDATNGAVKWIYKNATNGYTSSAAIVNNLVYEGSEDGSFYAFNLQTGEPVWQTLTGKAIESSPAVADGIIIFGTNGGLIIALDAATGKEKWRYSTGISDVKSSPLVADGMVFIGSNDGNIYALTTKGALKWTYSTGNNVESSPSMFDESVKKEQIILDSSKKDGTIFVGSKDFNFYALDSQTGALKWKFQTAGYVDSSPAISNDVVYFGSRNNFIYALDANTGRMLWRNTTGEKDKDYITSPAISGNMLYAVTHGGMIYAYSGFAQATPTPTAIPAETAPASTPTLTPAVTPAESPKAPGFEFSVVILLTTVLIKRRFNKKRKYRKS
jgi:outer membrane protein assembly factor BamB